MSRGNRDELLEAVGLMEIEEAEDELVDGKFSEQRGGIDDRPPTQSSLPAWARNGIG